VTVIATDGAGRIATNATKSYETQRVVGATPGHLRDQILGLAFPDHLFAAWGKVTRLSGDAFFLDDGSGKVVEVRAVGHGMSSGWFARARGVLSVGTPPILFSTAQQVNRIE
jgi:hypothetical protein